MAWSALCYKTRLPSTGTLQASHRVDWDWVEAHDFRLTKLSDCVDDKGEQGEGVLEENKRNLFIRKTVSSEYASFKFPPCYKFIKVILWMSHILCIQSLAYRQNTASTWFPLWEELLWLYKSKSLCGSISMWIIYLK